MICVCELSLFMIDEIWSLSENIKKKLCVSCKVEC